MSHLSDERISMFGRSGVEPTAEERTHLERCPTCSAQVDESKSMRRVFGALPLLAPSAAFARLTVAAFEAAWQKKRARDVARSLAACALLSLSVAAALLYWLPITALNTFARWLAQGAQGVRLVTHMVHGVTHLSPKASVPLLALMVVICFATTWLLERSVRLGRRTT